MESLWLAKVLNTANFLKAHKSKLPGLFWIPKNQNLRTLWECAQTQTEENMWIPTDTYLRDIYERPYTHIYGTFCESPQIQI